MCVCVCVVCVCVCVFPKAAIIRDCVYLRVFTPMRPCPCCWKNVDYRPDLAAAV